MPGWHRRQGVAVAPNGRTRNRAVVVHPPNLRLSKPRRVRKPGTVKRHDPGLRHPLTMALRRVPIHRSRNRERNLASAMSEMRWARMAALLPKPKRSNKRKIGQLPPTKPPESPKPAAIRHWAWNDSCKNRGSLEKTGGRSCETSSPLLHPPTTDFALPIGAT